jgi:raffinose/stachyose/melibiose transport system permease protein
VISSRDRLVAYALLAIGSVIALYPMFSIIMLSLKGPGDNLSGLSLPSSLYFQNYAEAWTRGAFSQSMLASIAVATAVVICSVVLAVLAAYGMALMRVPLAGLISVALLVGLVMPYESTVVSLYELMRNLNLINTVWALILPQIAMSMPFAVFWMVAFFRTVPRTILEAAASDGATRWQTLRLILVPIALPAIGTLATLLFLFTWNEFLLPLVLVPDNKSAQTVPLALSFFAGNRRNSQPEVTAAAAVLVALPILVMYVVLQRRLIQGIVSGAVKE